MKENILKKLYSHPERDEIISKLTLGISAQEINIWLSDKYSKVDKKLVLSSKVLKQFKDEYLDIYKQIQGDTTKLANSKIETIEIEKPETFINNNPTYRAKLQEYLDKELNIRDMVKNMIVAVECRISQIFDIIQENPKNVKPDYVLIQWMNTLANILEKQEALINGSSDKIVQQNNINIQILDQHAHIFQKVIREVISRFDHETSMLFIDILNEEMIKLKPTVEKVLPVDVRYEEAYKLEGRITQQLDIPSI